MGTPSAPLLKTQPLVGINNVPNAGDGFIRFSWLPPLDDGGSPIQAYQFEIRDLGGGLAVSGGLGPTLREYQYDGFPDGYQFIVYLRASNVGFSGPWGPTAQSQPWQVGIPPTVAPASISFSVESISSGLITYTQPSSLPFADIRWYVGRLSPYLEQQNYQQQKGRAATNTNEMYISSIGVQQISILGVQAVNCPGYSPATQLTYFPGQGSLFFDANLANTCGLAPGITFGSNSFTIQLWFKVSTTPSNFPILHASSKTLFFLTLTLVDDTTITVSNSESTLSYTVPTLSTDTWYYLVVARNGTDETVWLDGTRSSSGVQTDANTYSVTTNRIGFSDTVYYDGYLTNVRIVNGTALFNPSSSSIAVPTAQLVPVTGTELLLLECNSDSTYIDFANVQSIDTNAVWSSDFPF
jgi:hypothetical protein